MKIKFRWIAFISAVVLAAIQAAAAPSVRPGLGATPYPGGVTFRVWAPNATSVHVAGSFNGWNTTAGPLYPEANGWWSVDVPEAGLGHHYRYVLNGDHWRTDPRAKAVVNSTGNGIILNTEYDWAPFEMPAWNKMVIYEMHVGSFNTTPGHGPGTWQSAIAKLDHLESLGINAVKMMPIAEFPGDYSMGYNPVHLFAPESAYGSPDDLRQFVQACHQRGIAVILDVVYNHWGPTDLHYSLWQFDGYSAADYTGGIYFYEDDNRFTPWGDTRPNFASGPVRSFIRDNVMYWLTDYNMDGIRMDGTAYMRQRDIGQPDIPEGWSLMQWINDEINAAFPEKISIAEDMRNNEWLTRPTGQGGAGFDSQWDARFHHNVVSALIAPQDEHRNMWDIRDAITHLYNNSDIQRVIYTESHDEVGSASGNARVPEKIWPGNADSYYPKKRSTLGAGLVMTSPGIPMLFMGQEFLEDGAWHDDTPLDWSRADTNAGIVRLYTDLIRLRRNLSGLTRGLSATNVNVFHLNNTDKVIAFHRWHQGGPGDDVIVVANFSYQGYTAYNIGMPRGGRWRVRFNSDSSDYDPDFGNWYSYDTDAAAGAKDGLNFNANVGIGPYSLIVLSQGTVPDISGSGVVDLTDFSIFASWWLSQCDVWDACGGSDFTMSGTVDIEDLHIFAEHWLERLE